MNTCRIQWLLSGLRQRIAAFGTSRARPFLLSGLALALAALTLLAMSLISTRTGLAAPQMAPPAARPFATNVGGNISVDTTWYFTGSPYVVMDNVTVLAGATLTVEPGVEVYFAGGQALSVYGGLIAEGTVTQPIIFSAVPPTNTYYSRLHFQSGSHVRLDYCDISRAGSGWDAAVQIESSDVVIDHCAIHDNVGTYAALRLTGPTNFGAGLSPTIRNATITSNTGYAIYQDTVDMTPRYQNLTLTGNGTDAVFLNDGTINRPVTLDGPQLNGRPFIAENLRIAPSQTLTLTPGTELRFTSGRMLEVQENGTLIAQGTPTQPITITALTNETYNRLHFLSGSRVRLDYCDISRSGGGWGAAVQIESSDVVIDHCAIHDNVGTYSALRLTDPNFGAGLSPTIRNTTITSNTGYAIRQDTVDMTPLYQNLTLTGNGTDAVFMRHGTINRPVTLDGPQLNGRPFIAENLSIAPSQTLTLTPGTELRFTSGQVLDVQGNGTLIAQGTPTQPITITAHPPGGTYQRILLYSGSHVRLDYCDISRSGNGRDGAVQIESSDVVIDHCTIHDNVGTWAALLLTGPTNWGAGLSPTIRNTTITSNTGYAIYQYTVDMTPLYQNLTLTGNGTDAVFLSGFGDIINRPVTLDGPQLNGRPFVANNLRIAPSQTLTLTPGTELRLTSGRLLEVQENGTLIAQGTPTQPITITAHPPGNVYSQIRFNAGSHVRLDYCDISSAGAGSGVWTASSDVVIHHSTIHDNTGTGLYLASGARVDVRHTSLVRNGSHGVVVEGNTSALTMTDSVVMLNNGDGVRNTGAARVILGGTEGAGNDILGNTGLGANQVGTAGVITATYNWWGDPTGPYHPTLNPGGRGSQVSDRVVFEPWAVDWFGNPARELRVHVFGSLRVSPGDTTDYAISYISTLTGTIQNAVLVVNLPMMSSYLDSTGGGIYWPSRHQVFWKLGNLTPGSFGTVSVRVRYQWGIPEGTRVGILAAVVGTNFSQPLLNVDDYLNYVPQTVEERTTLTPAQFDAVRQASPDLNKLYNEVVASGFVSGTFESLRLSSGRVVTQAVLVRPPIFWPSVALVFQESDQAMAVIANRTSMVIATASERITLTLPEYPSSPDVVPLPSQNSGSVLITPAFSGWDCLWNCAVENVAGSILGEFIDVIGKMQTIPACVTWIVTGDSSALAGCVKPDVLPGADIFMSAFDCYKQYRTNPDYCKCKENKFECKPVKPFGLMDTGIVGVWKTPCNPSTGKYEFSQGEMSWYCPFCTMCMGGTGGSAMEHCRECGSDPCPPGMAQASLLAGVTPQSDGSGGSNCRKTCLFRPRDPNAKYGPEGDLMPGQQVTYTVTYENEGAGRAYGVYITDPLSEHFDPSTLTIYGNGIYVSSIRTIIWFVGELAPKGEPGSQGVVSFTVRLKENIPGGTPIINQATVYFPSAPEETPTNAVVNVVQPVVAVPRRVETAYMHPVTIPLEGRDVGNAPLTFTITAFPLHGDLSQVGNTAIYTPMENFVGVDEFSFTASNGITESRSAEVRITVRPQGDLTSPEIRWTWPESGTVKVIPVATPVYSDIVGPLFPPFAIIRFSEPMTVTRITTETVRMVTEGGVLVPIRVTYDGTMREAIVAPREPLQPMKWYTVTVTTGVRDLAGNPLSRDYYWSFRTAAVQFKVYLPLVLRNR